MKQTSSIHETCQFICDIHENLQQKLSKINVIANIEDKKKE